jgi:glycine dehydrogenase
MLLNFQTMIVDLTSLPIANASLLDEGTALAEAMNMCWAGNEKRRTVLVSSDVHPQNIAVLRSRAEPFGINVRVQPHADFDITDDVSSVIVQYPATNGQVDVSFCLCFCVHFVFVFLFTAHQRLASPAMQRRTMAR